MRIAKVIKATNFTLDHGTALKYGAIGLAGLIPAAAYAAGKGIVRKAKARKSRKTK